MQAVKRPGLPPSVDPAPRRLQGSNRGATQGLDGALERPVTSNAQLRVVIPFLVEGQPSLCHPADNVAQRPRCGRLRWRHVALQKLADGSRMAAANPVQLELGVVSGGVTVLPHGCTAAGYSASEAGGRGIAGRPLPPLVGSRPDRRPRLARPGGRPYAGTGQTPLQRIPQLWRQVDPFPLLDSGAAGRGRCVGANRVGSWRSSITDVDTPARIGRYPRETMSPSPSSATKSASAASRSHARPRACAAAAAMCWPFGANGTALPQMVVA